MSGVHSGWRGCGKGSVGGVGGQATAVWRCNLVNTSSGLYRIKPVFSYSEVIDDCLNIAIYIPCRV